MAELELLANESVGLNQVLQLKFEPSFQYLSERGGATSRLAEAKHISALRFCNVNYTLNGEKRLVQVSGETRPGETLTILGPIKAGKTKLLNVLAGTVRTARNQTLDGTFFADDEPMFGILRAGFVARNDAMFATATVEEQLNFSANLRLPANVSKDDRAAVIKDVRDSLGLEPFAHTLFRSLPVGIRKRVAIASELVTCPNALFLDEPTTNMESDVAWQIMRILNGLAASRACVVVCSIQNPPSAVFAELSHVILLGKGHVLYRGHASGLQAAFAAKSLFIPAQSNPADFVLMTARLLDLDALPRAETTQKLSIVTDETKGEPSENNLFQHRRRHRSAVYEFNQLLIRELRATRRDPRLFIGRLISQSIIMTLSACVFLHGADQSSPSYFLSTHFASFVFTMFSSCFGTMVPTVLFLYEIKPVLVRERAVNSYGTPPAIFARFIPQLVVNFVISVVTVLILYWAVGWSGSFILIVVAYYLLLLSCVSWSYVLAFGVSNVGLAVGLVGLVLVPQLLFMGTFVRITYLPIWLQWVSYVCNITYALRLIQNWELDQSQCHPQWCGAWRGLTNSNVAFPEHTWWFIVILILYVLVLRILSFVVLRRKIMNTTRFGEL